MKHLEAQMRKREDNTIEFILSTETVDRHGTVLRVDGWDLTSFNKNPIMAYQHKTYGSDPDDYIGIWTDVRVENGQLVGKPVFEPEEVNPKAAKIQKKVEIGTFRSVSVGFMPLEYHWGDQKRMEDPNVLYFDKMELLEVSIVGIPSNPDAVKRSYEELIQDFPKPELVEEIEDTTDQGRSIFEARLSLLTLNSKK